MKKILMLISIVLLVCMATVMAVACQPKDPVDNTPKVVDYAGEMIFDKNSNTAKQEVTVKTFIDGDTTHFNVPTTVSANGTLKARYIAVNTPESTGKIEDYGKQASRFTKEKLSQATSIYIESDTEKWNADSTGSRYVVWVWYRTSNDAPYRNLNVELLQNGLAIASNTANNRYGTTAVAALDQAKAQKLLVHSGVADPEVYRGDAVQVSLKELRTNVADYNGVKVSFEGVITMDSEQSIYVEEYDADLEMYFGMTCYYGFTASGSLLNILNVGSRVRIVGTVQYWEAGDSYQVSDLTYKVMKPNDPGSCGFISDGHEPGFMEVTADQFLNGKVAIYNEEEDTTEKIEFYKLAVNTTISMKNLYVKSVYTTHNGGDSDGAMTLTCTVDGKTVTIRTTLIYDENQNLITADAYKGKTINVKGLIDIFDGEPQIGVAAARYIEIVG